MYAVYGTDVELYYKPLFKNIEIARSNNYQIVIATTNRYLYLVEEYFAKYNDIVVIIPFDDVVYTGKEKLLRFLSVIKVEADFYFFKDSDSVMSKQEIDIMNNWMYTSTCNAMLIRNHSLHVSPILAGMFGINLNLSSFISSSAQDAIHSRKHKNNYSYDQQWLMLAVYPFIQKTLLVYTSFLFFKDEKYIQISFDDNNYIGKPNTHEVITNSYFRNSASNRLYSLSFINSLPSYLKFIIYGRVRPTMYILRLRKLLCNVF
jgi:hypothetical protein